MLHSRRLALRLLNTDSEDFPLSPQLRAVAATLGVEVRELTGHAPDAIAAEGADCDGLLVYRATIDGALLDLLPRCRVVARCGTGYERIDIGAARERGVVVTYVPDFCAEEMSDTVLLFVLAFARGLPLLLERGRRREWVPLREMPRLRRLRGRSLAVFGFGATGRRTAEKATALGLDVLVWSRTRKRQAVTDLGAREVELAEALAADFLSLHLPLTRETERFVGAEELQLVQPGAVLVNTARGALVDTKALVDSLRAGRLGGAGLDVTDPEPLPPDHPLWTLPNVLITSHTASLSEEAIDTAVRTALLDAAAVLAGERPKHPVP